MKEGKKDQDTYLGTVNASLKYYQQVSVDT